MTSNADIVGKTITAHVTRIEEYGLYLAHGSKTIFVLIVDVSNQPIDDLRKEYKLGEDVVVRVLRYVDEYKLYKGTIKDL